MAKPWAVTLAAGEGKRMRSSLPKVLHPLCGRPLIEHVQQALSALAEEQVIVVGHGAQQVRRVLGADCRYAYQEDQLGTGHALLQALPLLPDAGELLVVCGDTPLLQTATLEAMLAAHRGGSATVLTACVEQPCGYGRIVRDEAGYLQQIVEEKDADERQRTIREINAGAYCFDLALLKRYLPALSNNNAQGEYYLTDLVALLRAEGYRVTAFCAADAEEVTGVNDRVQLARCARVMRRRINNRHMEAGVTLIDPATTYIDIQVAIGCDTVIYPQTIIEGQTRIGAGCTIGPGTHLRDAVIAEGVTICQSAVYESVIDAGARIGPFTHLRPGSRIGRQARVGNFVEIKNSDVGEDSKIPHLSYVGDAQVGRQANMGAGTITVNYDGQRKSKTVIGDGAFVGCNSNLIAPVEIGDGAYIAAGSTISRDVPPDALAFGRARQVNKTGRAREILSRLRQERTSK